MTYYAVGASLLVLTISTFLIAFVDLGVGNLIVAMIIAAAKASLIVLYFMHARLGRPLTWLVILAGLMWVGILFTLTLSDYLSRFQSM